MSFVLTGIVESTGSANAGDIPVLDSNGLLDSSVLPAQGIVPTGAVQAFAMTTVPTGWLACDGSAVSRTTYANLYDVIGTTYGTGDGSTTFNLPSLKDKFLLGLGSTYSTLAATGGETTHTLTTSEMPSHTHTITYSYLGENNTLWRPNLPDRVAAGYDSPTPGGSSIVSTGGDGAHNNMPPYIVLNYCIKY
jgi:microcystin-dependent protein